MYNLRELDYTTEENASDAFEEKAFDDFDEEMKMDDLSFMEQVKRVYTRHEVGIQLFLVMLKLILTVSLFTFVYLGFSSLDKYVQPRNDTKNNHTLKNKA